MTRFALCALLALALAPAALAQSAGSTDDLNLDVSITPFFQIISLDDQDATAGDGELVFDFAPGLNDVNSAALTVPAAVEVNDRITFATNKAGAHQVDLAIVATNEGFWNDLTITVSHLATVEIAKSTGTDNVEGNCASGASSATFDDSADAATLATDIRLCHATQVVKYSVALDDITADATDRSFVATYTILATTP